MDILHEDQHERRPPYIQEPRKCGTVPTQRQLACFTAKPLKLNTWLSLWCGDIVEADALPTWKSPSALPQLSPPSPMSLNTTKNLDPVFYSGNICLTDMRRVSIVNADQRMEKENLSKRMTECRRSINFSQNCCWIFIVFGFITCVQTRKIVNVDAGHEFRKRQHLCVRVNLISLRWSGTLSEHSLGINTTERWGRIGNTLLRLRKVSVWSPGQQNGCPDSQS